MSQPAKGPLGSQGPSALVQRACSVQVADLLLECGNGKGLDVGFRIQRGLHNTQASLKPQPNTCDLTLFGLNPDHRKQLAKSTLTRGGVGIVPCIISAGYAGGRAVLFSGELRTANDKSQGPNVTTELSTGDGDTAIQQSRLSIAIPAGSSLSYVFNKVLEAFGVVQPGNLQKALAQIQQNPAAAQLFAKGGNLKGSAAEILSDLCRSTGFQWSVQNGALSIVALGQPLDGQAFAIDEDHGMEEAPTVDTKGIVSVKTRMIPGIVPGVKIALTSRNATGGYRVIGMETNGDTRANAIAWGHTLDCQRY